MSGTDITSSLNSYLASLKGDKTQKLLRLEKGTYYFSASEARSETINITNTIGEKEYRDGEKINMRTAAVWLEDIENLTIDFSGSVLVMRGEMSYFFLLRCKNVTLKNVTIVNPLPLIHKLTVTGGSSHSMEFTTEKGLTMRDGGCFFGDGVNILDAKNRAWWILTTKNDSDHHLLRSSIPPFLGCRKITGHGKEYVASFYIPNKHETGRSYYIYDIRRKQVGTLIDSCENITISDVKQNFNYSLNIVAQNSENINIERCRFEPDRDDFAVASIADFVQICMCRGIVKITDCVFDGAGDDVLNVHGFHFPVTSVRGNTIKMKFAHAQSYGYECVRQGDVLAAIDKMTLLEKGRAGVVSASLCDPYTYEVTLDGDVSIFENAAAENVSASPAILFENNTIDRIPTRGVLATTRGSITIKNNKFLNTGMAGILVSDDASTWFESSMTTHAEITGNEFCDCDDCCILIKPEYKRFSGSVHGDFIIDENKFLSGSPAVIADGARGLYFRNNIYKGEKSKLTRIESISGEIT